MTNLKLEHLPGANELKNQEVSITTDTVSKVHPCVIPTKLNINDDNKP